MPCVEVQAILAAHNNLIYTLQHCCTVYLSLFGDR